MELTFAWFWLVKLTLLAIWVSLVVRGFYLNYKRKSKEALKYHIAGGIIAILAVVAPIKMSVNTAETVNRQNTIIQQNKQLPEKVKDTSFEDSKKLDGISKAQIWER
jgi:cytochrome b561